jgi:hypothetical protein
MSFAKNGGVFAAIKVKMRQEKGLTVYVGGAPTNNTVASQLDAAQLCAVDYDVERNRFVKVDSGRIEKLFGEDFGDTIAKLVFMCPLYTHLKEFTNVFACGEKSGLNILRNWEEYVRGHNKDVFVALYTRALTDSGKSIKSTHTGSSRPVAGK